MCRRSLVFIIIVLLTSLFDSASAVEWTGLVNNSWCTPQNWDSFAVPGDYDAAFIVPITPRDPIIDCDVTVNNLYGPRYFGDDDQSMAITSGTVLINGEWRWGTSGSGTSFIDISGSPHITVYSTLRGTDRGQTEFNMSGNPTLMSTTG
jgi:hypothetical protein